MLSSNGGLDRRTARIVNTTKHAGQTTSAPASSARNTSKNKGTGHDSSNKTHTLGSTSRSVTVTKKDSKTLLLSALRGFDKTNLKSMIHPQQRISESQENEENVNGDGPKTGIMTKRMPRQGNNRGPNNLLSAVRGFDKSSLKRRKKPHGTKKTNKTAVAAAAAAATEGGASEGVGRGRGSRRIGGSLHDELGAVLRTIQQRQRP